MNMTQPVVITCGDESKIIRMHKNYSVRDILNDVEAAIVEMYESSEVVFQEFVECGELEIKGLPLNLQMIVFAELKDQIDGDEIFIENRDQEYPCMRLDQYLLVGPGQDICGAIQDTLNDQEDD